MTEMTRHEREKYIICARIIATARDIVRRYPEAAKIVFTEKKENRQ